MAGNNIYRVSVKVAKALEAVKNGAEPQQVVRGLSWREMEEFLLEACSLAGFKCVHNLRLKAGGKRLQLDVVASTPSLCLIIDCKRWRSRLTGQVLQRIVEKNLERTKSLADRIESIFAGGNIVFFTPVVISLYEPGQRTVLNVFVLSVNSLTALLRNPEHLLAGAAIKKKLKPNWQDFLD